MLSKGYQCGLGNKMYRKLNLPKTAALVHLSIYRVGIGDAIYKIVLRIANNKQKFFIPIVYCNNIAQSLKSVRCCQDMEFSAGFK